MHNCRCHDPYFILTLLYGEEEGEKAAEKLKERLKTFKAPAASPPMDEKDSLLITYADQFQKQGEKPLRTLAEFSDKYLKGVVSGLHILPFFPFSSDDGFSVMDYRLVNPAFGDWSDIRYLAREFNLMFDAVINHASAKGIWFQKFLAGEQKYLDYFVTANPQTDLSGVVRPRTSQLLTRFETAAGEKWVWTTFSADQVDLNFKNPDLLLEVVDILLFYVENGANFIRLDAIAYLWKEIGTSCIHLPQTHLVVNFFNALFKLAAPYVQLITETNVPHRDNVSYFGNGSNEAHLVYNFALPPLVLHAFLKGNAAYLTRWAGGLSLPTNEVTFFNFLASHDGVGLNPARGILPEAEIENMVEIVKSHAGLISYKTNSDGSKSPYEMNISYFDAINDPESPEPLELQARRFLASQAIMLAVVGLPGIYVHSLLGSRNWLEGVQKSGQNRTINRYKFDLQELETNLQNPVSLPALVYKGYKQLLQARASSPAFHPHGAQLVFDLGEKVFALLRLSADGLRSALCIHSVSPEGVIIDFEQLKGQIYPGKWKDLLNGGEYEHSLNLEPYQVVWLVSEME